jgi:hypothetical protein
MVGEGEGSEVTVSSSSGGMFGEGGVVNALLIQTIEDGACQEKSERER